ncbi:phospholipid scramblase 2-like isoform X2 [Phymastichus coffea]|uniref:phospholipid scramblase 2-like isoform X2 n=1 Tax=Phymastichus coffea TaxID=108790 RepID=UPI00273B95CD|nr:phospholipid scramblase 2-like isoform X2 [Phymastichus coffea]
MALFYNLNKIHRADSLREAQERQAARSAPATPDALAAPRNLQAQQQQHRSAPSTPTSVAKPTAPPPPPPPPPPPSAGGWLRTSTTFPPGLRSLMPLDRLLVYREPDGPEAARTWDTEKRYRVTDLSGQQLYTAVEESSWCGRCCLGHCRGWTFHVLDLQGHEVLRIERRLRSASCCFPCCLQKVAVYAEGELLGSATQNWNALRPSFTIRDLLDEPVLFMKGPPCLCLCRGEIDFVVKSIDKLHSVGVITRKWTGIAREFFRDGNCFAVGFPADLDARVKATLLAACLLVDFIYFEEATNLNRINK